MSLLIDSINVGNQKLPSVFSDPFTTTCIDRIYLYLYPRNKEDKVHGSIKFSRQRTTGEQDFRGETFEAVMAQMKEFIEEIDKK
jgi:hypothetical protein